jgi:GNAT superfamily N-acetyltransferase
MAIVPADHEDAGEIARLVNLAYEVERFFVLGDRTSPDRVRAAMDMGAFLVVRNDSHDIIGCVYVETRDRRGTFGMLAVDPRAQGRGWGGQLIDAAEERARDAGCDTMEIQVVNLREELFPRYWKLGYVAVGTRPYEHRPTIQDCHFVVMTKTLK